MSENTFFITHGERRAFALVSPSMIDNSGEDVFTKAGDEIIALAAQIQRERGNVGKPTGFDARACLTKYENGWWGESALAAPCSRSPELNTQQILADFKAAADEIDRLRAIEAHAKQLETQIA